MCLLTLQYSVGTVYVDRKSQTRTCGECGLAGARPERVLRVSRPLQTVVLEKTSVTYIHLLYYSKNKSEEEETVKLQWTVMD